MYYINRKNCSSSVGPTSMRETVSEYPTYSEARKDLPEYRMSDPNGDYWISARCCKNWRERIDMIEDIVSDMEDWDLDDLLGWAQNVRRDMLLHVDPESVREEWEFLQD